MRFLDTYALIEIIKGNPRYRHFEALRFVTSIYNLMELYYYFLRKSDVSSAEKYFAMLRLRCTPIADETLKAAMKLRVKQRSERNLISYVDCVGYVAAFELHIPFVTGEKHFRNLENVEFIV